MAGAHVVRMDKTEMRVKRREIKCENGRWFVVRSRSAPRGVEIVSTTIFPCFEDLQNGDEKAGRSIYIRKRKGTETNSEIWKYDENIPCAPFESVRSPFGALRRACAVLAHYRSGLYLGCGRCRTTDFKLVQISDFSFLNWSRRVWNRKITMSQTTRVTPEIKNLGQPSE